MNKKTFEEIMKERQNVRNNVTEIQRPISENSVSKPFEDVLQERQSSKNNVTNTSEITSKNVSRKNFDEIIQEREKKYNKKLDSRFTAKLDDYQIQAERNIVKKYGTFEEFLEDNENKLSNRASERKIQQKHLQTMYEDMITQERTRLYLGSNYYGLTNKEYQEYLDNLSKNATSKQEKEWLDTQKENLETLKNVNVRTKVKNALYTKIRNPLASKKNLIKNLGKELNISYEQAESLYDTLEREYNAEYSKKLEEKADELTDKGFLGKAAAQFLSIGANVESTFGVLEAAGTSLKNGITGEYSPIDTNTSAYAAGKFRDKVRGNIEEDIVGGKGEDASLLRKGLGVVYQGSTSAFDSLGQGLLLGPTGAMLAMGGQAATGATQEAFERTGSNTKALATGLAAGGIEALTEKMGLDNAWEIIQNSGKAAGRSFLANMLAQAGIEGIEELTSEQLNTVADYLINQADSNLAKNAEEYKGNGLSNKEAWKSAIGDAFKQSLKAGLTGAVSGMFGGAMSSAVSVNYSENEKQVIEKEVERRIAEKEKQGKVTAKEKAEIRKEVQSDLEKGDISIEAIEQALGGETLEEYNSYVQQEEQLTKELEEAGKASNTVANAKKYDEVSTKLKELQSNKNTLKEQLSKEVSDLTKSDMYLRESYNQKAQRGKAFEADVSKYDKKQQAVIQKAIDSGILNNTKKTHAFVDWIAKISADKGVSFDFTNNQKLKESGFAKEGVSVNGYVKDENITLNINSAKALNKVVGHEIMHVLEGSELYAKLQEAVKEYATTKGEYDSKLEAIRKLYKNIKGADINKELTADLIGEYLFTDEAFVRQLSAKHRNIFLKIYDEIKYLVKKVTAGSKEAKQLEKVKKLFDEVYRETSKQVTEKTQNSISDIVDLSSDNELQKRVDGLYGAEKYKIIQEYILDVLSEQPIKLSDGKEAVVDKRDALHIANKSATRKTAEISKIKELIEKAQLCAEDKNVKHNKFDYFCYYRAEVKFAEDTFTTYLNVGRGKNDGKYHIYDITKNIKDTADRINGLERPKPNEGYALQNDISKYSIPENTKNTTKKSLSNDDIAPTTGWNIKGSDIALDDDITIRKDIAQAQKMDVQQGTSEGWNPYDPNSTDDLDEGPFTMSDDVGTEENLEDPEEAEFTKKSAERIRNCQANIKGLQMSKELTVENFDKTISKKTFEYEALSRKDTQRASNLLTQIESLKAKKDRAVSEIDSKIKGQEEAIGRIKSQEVARRRKKKQNELRERARELIGDTSKWKDKKWGISYQRHTLRRNLMDIVKDENGKPDYERAEKIYEALQGKYNSDEATLNREGNSLKQKFREMKINKVESVYIQMLGEYRYNPDSTLTAEVMEEYYEEHKDKIDTEKVDKAIELARKDYDALYTRLNTVLREHGFKEIPYREGYFPHFTEERSKLAKFFEKTLNWKSQNNEIPTDIAGLTEMFEPNRSYQSFDKHRTSDNTTYDFLKGYDTYVNGALDWIYHIEDIQMRRAVENEIRYQHSEKGVKEAIEKIRNNPFYDTDQMQAEIEKVYENAKNPLNNFVQDLRKGTQMLAGKKDTADRNLESRTSRQVYSTMTNISNRVTANMVVGSVSSALTNFIPITQSWSQVSPVSSLVGMKNTIQSYIRDDGVVDKSNFLTNRLRQNENLYKTGWNHVENVAGFLMESIDNFTSQTIWRSKYRENIKNGMSEEAAIKNADQFSENVMAGRSRGNMPTIFNEKNPIIKVFTAFQLEVANQYGYMFKDMPRDMKNESMGKLVKGYLSMYVGAYVYNALFSKLTGRDAAFDPIGILEELIKDLRGGDEEDEEKKVAKALTNLATNIAEETPFLGGLMGGGRIPISSALPYDGISVDSFSEMMNDLSEGNMTKFWKEILKPAYYVAMPMAGGQLKKTNEGLAMFDDDLPIAGSYTDSGKLRFTVDDDIPSRIKAAVFGQYANENAREYFDEERSPLNEKQTQELVDLDIPIRDYWEIQDGLKGKEKLADKIDYIADLDIPIAKKNILANNQTQRKTPIDLTDYHLYENIDELDFATSQPEKYKVAKAVGGYSDYKVYNRRLNAIKASKDQNGKTISGSRKEKVINYLNNISADYGTKLILFKQEFPGDDTYNQEIVEYLNGRNDLSYSDIETILKELGFEVTSDGTVRW